MNGLAGAVMLVSLVASLFLAVRAFRSHRLEFNTMAWMAAAWMAIIGITALIIGQLGL